MASLKRPSWGAPDTAGDFKRRKTEENHATPPSKVLHVRNVADGTREHHIITAVRRFGKVSYVTLMPRVRQALIEFETLDAAVNCVQFCKEQSLMLLDRPAFFNFSVSQNIKRAGQLDGQYQEYGPNSILLFTILNPMYPINVYILHTICSRAGAEPLRIAVFHKNGVQALVELASVEDAEKCKKFLDGADIYGDCCTVKIEYSKADRVNVAVNGDESWDFTVAPPNSAAQGFSATPRRPPLQPTPVQHPGQGAAQSYGYPYQQQQQHQQQPHQQHQQLPQQQQQQQQQFPMPSFQGNNQTAAFPGQSEPGAVLMVYGLDARRMNCDRLFNIVCAYGNVVRIKMLVKKAGCAMIQMEKREGAFNALKWLHQIQFMGQTLQLSFSHHPHIEDRGPANKCEDGSPAVVDYAQSRNNRFYSAEQSRKNLMIAPTRILHFFNAPSSATEENLMMIFSEAGVTPPASIKMFEKRGDSNSRCTGLMEWSEACAALEGMAMCNHTSLTAPSGQVFTLKLAFSLAAQRGHPGGDAMSCVGGQQTIPVVAPSLPAFSQQIPSQVNYAPAVGSFVPAIEQTM